MSQLGRIEQWNDDKGYGFVRPLESQTTDGNAARAFVHIKAIARAGRRPANGDLVRHDVERDARGRLNAVNVSFVNAEVMRAQAQRRVEAKVATRERRTLPAKRAKWANHIHRFILTCTVIALVAGTVLKLWPLGITLVYVVMSTLSCLLYLLDKTSAGKKGYRRTRENTLHTCDLLCGWPGGLLAQQLFRHKTRKDSFQFMFWVTVALNCAALYCYWLVSRIGTAS